MTHTAEDAAIMLNTMQGLDEKDSTSMAVADEDYTVNLNNSLQGLAHWPTERIFRCRLRQRHCPASTKCHQNPGRLGRQLHRNQPTPYRSSRPCLLRNCPRRGLSQLIALRWRALRSPLQQSNRPYGFIHSHSRRRLWRGSTATHFDWYLRPVGRFL